MALAVIGGLFVSTALSLLVVPAFFVATDGLGARIHGWAGGLKAGRSGRTERGHEGGAPGN
jgi:hypothetical protein